MKSNLERKLKSDKIKTSPREGEVDTKCRVRGNYKQTNDTFLRLFDTSLSVIRRLHPQCAPDATEFLSDVYKRSTRARKFLADGVQCGRSMIEMLGVLAIIGVLSVGGIAGYSKAMEQFKIIKTIDYLTQIVTNIQTLYMQQKTYNGLTTQSALQTGVYPDNSYRLPLGKNTSVFPLASNDGLLFGLRICGLTERQCVMLSTQDWSAKTDNGLYGVSLNLAHNFLNGATGIKQNGKSCQGYYEQSNAYFACADNGKNLITFAIANKYCYTGYKEGGEGSVCIGLFFK